MMVQLSLLLMTSLSEVNREKECLRNLGQTLTAQFDCFLRI